MQIDYLHLNRGENIVSFDTDTDEGRKKLADEFSRMVRSGTSVMLELGGPGGETYRIQRYDPAKDRLHVAVTPEQAAPPESESVDEEDDDEVTEVEASPAKEPGPGVTEPDSSVPEELKGRVAKVGDQLTVDEKKKWGKRTRTMHRRYRVVAVAPGSGTVVAVAPVSGGSGGALSGAEKSRRWRRNHPDHIRERDSKRTSYFKQWRKTPAGRAKDAWNHICDRAGNKNGESKSRSYRSVEVRITREEFIAWAVPAFEDWMRLHAGKRPSVDRIENDGHYEVGNLRIIELGDNVRRQPRHKNVNAPSGMAWCRECKDYKHVSEFYSDSHNAHGLQNLCKVHSDESRKSRAC